MQACVFLLVISLAALLVSAEEDAPKAKVNYSDVLDAIGETVDSGTLKSLVDDVRLFMMIEATKDWARTDWFRELSEFELRYIGAYEGLRDIQLGKVERFIEEYK